MRGWDRCPPRARESAGRWAAGRIVPAACGAASPRLRHLARWGGCHARAGRPPRAIGTGSAPPRTEYLFSRDAVVQGGSESAACGIPPVQLAGASTVWHPGVPRYCLSSATSHPSRARKDSVLPSALPERCSRSPLLAAAILAVRAWRGASSRWLPPALRSPRRTRRRSTGPPRVHGVRRSGEGRRVRQTPGASTWRGLPGGWNGGEHRGHDPRARRHAAPHARDQRHGHHVGCRRCRWLVHRWSVHQRRWRYPQQPRAPAVRRNTRSGVEPAGHGHGLTLTRSGEACTSAATSSAWAVNRAADWRAFRPPAAARSTRTGPQR